MIHNVEACDDANDVKTDGWASVCTLPYCGDGIINLDEECDDMDRVDFNACSNHCRLPRNDCGDTVVDADEECDDGNESNDDACSTDCRILSTETCLYACEAVGTAATDAPLCTAGGACYCRYGAGGRLCDERPDCGDGFVQGIEACDDGDANGPNGACSLMCTENE